MIFRAIAIWFLILIFAVVNGFVRERFLIPSLGDLPGHIVSTLILSAVVLVAIVATAGWIGFDNFSGAFLVGHYLFGEPWGKLLADYDILHGRIWPLVLITELVAPAIAVWLKSRG